MPRTYLDRDLKLLWGLAAARCSFPKCRIELVAQSTASDPAAVLGQISHIVGYGEEGPRFDRTFPEDQINKYDNLILLCPTHHTLVDKQQNTYTVANLKGWKVDHEQWVREQLVIEVPGVSFAELEVAVRAILGAPGIPTTDFTIISPQEKMQRNGLSSTIHILLTVGLAKAKEVGQFIENMSKIDIDYPERLKSRFVDEYRRLREEGTQGDHLFEAMQLFACKGFRSFKEQAAGLAVLTYLFEACEIFER